MSITEPTLLSEYLNSTKQILLSRGDKPSLPISSIQTLNNRIWGLPKGRMTVIGARTGQGKTALVLQIANDIAKIGKSVFYLSFEMTHEEILERLFCSLYQIDGFKLKCGKFSEYFSMWEDFEDYIGKMKFVVSDGFGKDWKELMAFIKDLTVKPDVMILDYMQAISQTVNHSGKEFIDNYINNFRIMCLKTGIAGVVISQLNRETVRDKDAKPGLHNLKGTGYLEELADLVLLLDWVGQGNEEHNQKYAIEVAKNRSGKTGFLEICFDAQYYRFRDKTIDDMDEKEKYEHFTEKAK